MHRKSHSNNKIRETKNDNIENCPFCDPKFQTKDVLKNHVTSTHVKKLNFSCENCERAVKYRRILLKHMKWHEDPKLLRFPPANTTASAATPEDENKNEAKNGDKENNEEKNEAEHGEDEKANEPTANANESEANDEIAKDHEAANLKIEPKTEPKSPTESKARYKLIHDSEPQPKAQEIENSPGKFGSCTCQKCNNGFQNKNPLNHKQNMHANLPCEKCNCESPPESLQRPQQKAANGLTNRPPASKSLTKSHPTSGLQRPHQQAPSLQRPHQMASSLQQPHQKASGLQQASPEGLQQPHQQASSPQQASPAGLQQPHQQASSLQQASRQSQLE